MNNQKLYLSKIQTNSGSPILVTNLYYSSEIDKWIPGKRENPENIEFYDDRTVLINEVVYDFDYNSFKLNLKSAVKVLDSLSRRNIPYIITATGGKGIHIHTFFNPLKFTKEEHKTKFKEALSYNFSFKNIRMWLWNMILDESGIPNNHRGKGNFLDSAVVDFNYFKGSSHLIREIGGRKRTKDDVDNEDKIFYKTMLDPENLPRIKPKIYKFEDVKFPETIPMFDVDEFKLVEFIELYINKCRNESQTPFKDVALEQKYTDLNGVLRVREGLDTGNRNLGALVISIACHIDNMTEEEAVVLLKEYVDNCGQTGHKFSLPEAMHWYKWISRHEKPYWNCGLLEDLNVHEPDLCEYCQTLQKDAIKLLKSKNFLKKIGELLNQEIVGEDDTKVLLFLLMLSKNFPSETGRPDWNILGDPTPQNIILAKDSGAGKSWIVKKILKIFGEKDKDYFVISRITKSALNYYTNVNMDNKIIFIEEMQGMDDATPQLRVWMSEGQLSLSTVEKIRDPEDGVEKNTLVQKTTFGRPVFVTNQAESVVEEQLNNRTWVVSLDVSSIQTNNILSFQDEVKKGNVKYNLELLRNIKDALKQLKAYHYKIPYADHEVMNIPINEVRARRDYQKFLTLIQCSAYLHQKQRKIVEEDGKEYLICSLIDYEVAKQFSYDILGAIFSGLTNQQIDLINHIKNSGWGEEFMISDLLRTMGKTQPHWYGQLKQLENLGYVMVEGSPGISNVYKLIVEKTINVINLPSAEQLKTILEKKGIKNLYFDVEIDEKESIEENGVSFEVNNKNISTNKPIKIDTPISEINLHNKNVEPFKTDAFIGVGELYRGKLENIAPINLPPLDKFEKVIYTKNENLRVDKGPNFIGGVSRANIIEYLKKNNNKMVDVMDIHDKFGKENTVIVDNILKLLKHDGTIIEPKPGFIQLL